MLTQIQLKGFKSIRDVALELRSLNVLIGVNGAGKSNLVSFFKMINEMMSGRLQEYIAKSGRSQSLLHFGPKKTQEMKAVLDFVFEDSTAEYSMRLVHAAGDALAFSGETVRIRQTGVDSKYETLKLGSGYEETRIVQEADKKDTTAQSIRRVLNGCRVYHFHDTSPEARVRQYCYVGDDRWPMSDGGNLAAILYRLRTSEEGPAYARILSSIRRIAPFFDDFDLEPTGVGDKDIILNWRQKGSDQVFGPHQLSDGTLRAMALVTLLQQPVDDLPDLIVVDEPELGLHPAAKSIVAGLLKKASHHCQVIVATQSAALLDAFDAEDVVVVERDARESKFCRQDGDTLHEWLEEYSLGQLWEKNVIGGGPF